MGFHTVTGRRTRPCRVPHVPRPRPTPKRRAPSGETTNQNLSYQRYPLDVVVGEGIKMAASMMQVRAVLSHRSRTP